MAEKRRKLNFQQRMQKIQNEMEKVKTAQMRVKEGNVPKLEDEQMNDENVNTGNMVAQNQWEEEGTT